MRTPFFETRKRARAQQPHSLPFTPARFRHSLLALTLGCALVPAAHAEKPIEWQEPGLQLRPRLSFETDVLRNRELAASDMRTKTEITPKAKLNARWQIDRRWGLEGELELNDSTERETGKSTEHDTQLKVKQLYGEAQLQEYGARLRLGRVSHTDDRGWFFDTEFDGVEATLEQGPWQVVAFYAREGQWNRDLLSSHETRSDGTDYLAALGTYHLSDTHQLLLKALHQNNDRTDQRLTHLAAGSQNMPKSGMQHWAMASLVSGHEGGRSVLGEAIDLGATWFLDEQSPWAPRATVGYAWGSGDDGNGKDNAHRQSGLQNNKAEMGNIMDFEVYGVALDPQLSNLHVLTAGVGFAPMEKSTLDLVFHHYRQDKLAALENERTNLRPRADQQNERALGNGIDLIWGWRPNKQWRVEVAAGVFLPSGRFRQSDKADADKARNVYAGNVEIKYYPNWTF